MTKDEEIISVPILNKTPLTQEELLAVWQQDEFWGCGGDYTCDPFTGVRTPIISGV